jgi:hypothetical protein
MGNLPFARSLKIILPTSFPGPATLIILGRALV